MMKRVTLFLALMFSAAFAQSVYAYDFDVTYQQLDVNETPYYSVKLFFNIVSEGNSNDPYNFENENWDDLNPQHTPSATCELTYKSVVERDGKMVYNEDYSLGNQMLNISHNVFHYNGKRYRLMGIGEHAFENCKDIQQVCQTEVFDYIGKSAFQDCQSLTNWTWLMTSQTETQYFSDPQMTYPIKTFYIYKLTEIPDSAFYGCTQLKKIELAENVEKIGVSAFEGCPLTELYWRGKFGILDMQVGDNAFKGVDPESCKLFVWKAFNLKEKLKGMTPWNNFNVVEMVSYFTGDPQGVEDVEVSQDAPVEYYNLQGMRLAQPEAGQVVVKRQGGSATKMIVK